MVVEESIHVFDEPHFNFDVRDHLGEKVDRLNIQEEIYKANQKDEGTREFI